MYISGKKLKLTTKTLFLFKGQFANARGRETNDPISWTIITPTTPATSLPPPPNNSL
jgi:hypothetical protein